MTKFMKHVGTLRNTSTRVVIVFNRIPGRTDHALVTEVDSLPDRIKDPLENLLVTEGQNVDEFYKILSRRLMPDSNRNVLLELHESGYLRPVPTKDIIFNLGMGRTTTLEEVLKEMEKQIVEEASRINPEEMKVEENSETISTSPKTTIPDESSTIIPEKNRNMENSQNFHTTDRSQTQTQFSPQDSNKLNELENKMNKLSIILEKLLERLDRIDSIKTIEELNKLNPINLEKNSSEND